MSGFFSAISSKLILVQFVVIVLLGLAGWFYFNHSQKQMARLIDERSKLQVAVAAQNQTINTLEQAAERQDQEMQNLQGRLSASEVSRRRLEARLRKLDLNNMGRTDAADLEGRINRGTQRAFEDIEALTGGSSSSPPSAAPRGADSRSGSNTAQPPPRPPVTSLIPRGTP